MRIVEYSDVPDAAWNQVVLKSPDGWPFALAEWRRVILSVAEWQLEDHSFAVADEDGLVAVVPLQLDRRSRVLGITGWGGCGPVIASSVSERRSEVLQLVFDEVDRRAARAKATALRFSVPPVTQTSVERAPKAPFATTALEDFSGLAQVIDLSVDEDKLWRGLSETARQTVRRAEKAGLSVVQADWASSVEDYYRIHVANYRRTGARPHPKTYFMGIAKRMAPLGYSVLWMARDAAGAPLAFHNDMHFKLGTWYHTGCSSEAALACGANYLLFWRAMLGAKNAGRHWYDCGEVFPPGIDKKRDGLTLFKTRFGGAPRLFFKVGKDYAVDPEIRALSARSIIRRIRRCASALAGVNSR